MVHQLNCTHPLASQAGNVSESDIRLLLLEEERQEFLLKIPALIFMMIYVFLGIPGNLLVILVYSFRFRPSTSKTFIMSLSIFDLISCVLGIPFEMIDLRYDLELDVPVACKLLRFIITFCACGSTLILLSVAADRFRRICQPFTRQMSIRQSKIVLGCMTGISAIISLPALVLYGRRTNIYRDVVLVDCTIDDQWAETSFANGYQFILGLLWVSSILVLCVMYGVIIYKIRKQEVRRLNLTCNSIASVHASKFYNTTSSNAVQSPTTTQERSRASSDPSGLSNSPSKTRIQNKNAAERYDGNPDERRPSENGKLVGPRQRNSFNRLFSRDANPIFEEEDEAHKSPNIHGDQDETCIQDKSATFNLEEPIQEELIENGDATVIEWTKTNDQSRSYSRSKSEYHEVCGTKTNSNGLSNNSSRSLPCLEKISSIIPPQNGVEEVHTNNTDNLNPDLNLKRSSSLPENKENRVHFTNNITDISGGEEGRPKGRSDLNASKDPHSLRPQTKEDKSEKPLNVKNGSTVQNGDKQNAHENRGELKTLHVDTERSRHVSDDRSFDRITSVSDETNGSILTLNDSRVNPIRHRKVSAYSVSRQASFTSNSNSNDRSNRNSYCSQNSAPGRIHKNSTASYTGKMSVASTTTRELKTSRIAVMMFYVTMGHVLSYLPHLAIQFHRALGPQSITRLLCNSVYFAFHHLLLRSIFLNNAINPIIYSYNNSQFRKYCAQLLKKPLSFCRKTRQKSYTIDSAHSLTMD